MRYVLRCGKSTTMEQEVPPSRSCGWQAPPPIGPADRARDTSKHPPTQVGSLRPLPKTYYAQVVQRTCHAYFCRTAPFLGAPPLVRRSSSMVVRR
jgi:hypothetical protein